MKSDRHCFQQRCLRKREILGKVIRDACRQRNEFCERASATVISTGNSENFPTIAEIHFTDAAMSTLAAVDGRIDSDAIAYLKARNSVPNARDDACSFMTHDEGRNATP